MLLLKMVSLRCVRQPAVEVMDMLVELYQEKGKSLPKAEILYNSVA